MDRHEEAYSREVEMVASSEMRAKVRDAWRAAWAKTTPEDVCRWVADTCRLFGARESTALRCAAEFAAAFERGENRPRAWVGGRGEPSPMSPRVNTTIATCVLCGKERVFWANGDSLGHKGPMCHPCYQKEWRRRKHPGPYQAAAQEVATLTAEVERLRAALQHAADETNRIVCGVWIAPNFEPGKLGSQRYVRGRPPEAGAAGR